jgi:hypothetical protein
MLGQQLLLSFLLAVNLVSAFAPISPVTQQQSSLAPIALRMFDPKPLSAEGDAAKPLESASTPDATEAGDDAAEEPVKAVYKNLARDGQYEEVKWVDPAMEANSNPLLMSWWGYILAGLPILLLADDAFHFLPKEGPLAFLQGI